MGKAIIFPFNFPRFFFMQQGVNKTYEVNTYVSPGGATSWAFGGSAGKVDGSGGTEKVGAATGDGASCVSWAGKGPWTERNAGGWSCCEGVVWVARGE